MRNLFKKKVDMVEQKKNVTFQADKALIAAIDQEAVKHRLSRSDIIREKLIPHYK